MNTLQLSVVLPHRTLLERDDVAQITLDTLGGSWCLLPRRLDCTAALIPGIALYLDADGAEHAIAIDEGVLVKSGREVTLAVRDALAGVPLGDLAHAVTAAFGARAAREAEVNAALARLESGFVRRFADLERG
ncbi:MAG: F0F1 ATP synthase subunit epsilon [Gammaproteobacteria bacterium]